MRRYSLLPTLILLFACSNTDLKLNNEGAKNTEYQAGDLNGDWKFVRADMVENTPFLSKYKDPHPVVDEYTPMLPPYKGPDLRFEEDSMYVVNYPVSINDRTKFSLDSGYLFTYTGRELNRHYPIELKMDTLYRYEWYHGESYIRETYVKARQNDSVMHILKTHGVNYPELVGSWSLVREEGFNDGSEYTLKFPFKIPDSIKLTREELIQMTKNKMVYWMTTSGKKRDYVLSYEWGSLQLRPGKWYKGEDPWIHFDKE